MPPGREPGARARAGKEIGELCELCPHAGKENPKLCEALAALGKEKPEL